MVASWCSGSCTSSSKYSSNLRAACAAQPRMSPSTETISTLVMLMTMMRMLHLISPEGRLEEMQLAFIQSTGSLRPHHQPIEQPEGTPTSCSKDRMAVPSTHHKSSHPQALHTRYLLHAH
jgi:hypothetical protein